MPLSAKRKRKNEKREGEIRRIVIKVQTNLFWPNESERERGAVRIFI